MKNIQQMPDGYLNKTPIFQFILLSCLFPLWGAAASLNDILITQFKSVFTLSDFASALVQSAFYGGYFLIAIPASLVIKKTSYKIAILVGLTLYIVGCSMFYPASHMATYTMFLAAIFSIAIGLSFLETSANTYSSMIGHKDYATLRLNISQTFYPVGAIAGILLGKYLIFQEGTSLHEQIATMTPEQLHAFKLATLEHTLQPYKYLIFVLIAVTILFLITPFPKCKSVNDSTKHNNVHFIDTLKYLAKNSAFKKGIVAQFLYVGMQVAVWSFTIRLALNLSEMNERDASNFMVYSFIGFFVGKFVANFLMTKFKSDLVLFIYSILGVFTLAYTAFVHDFSAVYAAIFASVLFGPCWATIYASVLDTVEQEHREVAGAVVVMSIIGAAVVPAIHGYVSDTIGSLQTAFIVPLFCFAYVGYYFFDKYKAHK
ncbi:L-fucose:H+ symporter permease [Rodentibacter pneumotropicus]|uniref:L-fucose:H+ symporter permease n=1 Tax=Rodentibacter pneumotropicus TaxID=758 RepID=A0A4S2PA34_9PAST|nr:L-fucose:H+ symporter permease [Rodentibacter pneumotropicus]OOF61505.1 L-fucose:H+ symporter permease [Rodentibacter pneumotropicus]TGZ98310.1 L-fucose:H+ symporter permease [Rodentibacter pneumotropicus]TGZ99962.1 L-fucose:H+ symporter permease [Rodentibacter pneumotropicus]THA07534.1 L-fucose:H+ symporter permease [Rodentibacter pneumotropicus]THA14380.1 L-fucose:H+ symporter permease [Rodentibacter pneumotropicus]